MKKVIFILLLSSISFSQEAPPGPKAPQGPTCDDFLNIYKKMVVDRDFTIEIQGSEILKLTKELEELKKKENKENK